MSSLHRFFAALDGQQSLSAFLILFAVIDILGNIPIIINMRKQVGCIYPGKTTVAVGIIMVGFLFVGPFILELFHIDLDSFATAGGIILFLLGLEMVLNITIFKVDTSPETAAIVPLAFPILAGTGTLTALLTLKAEYNNLNIICAIVANLMLIYFVLQYSERIERRLGPLGVTIVHKVMGLMLLAIAIKLFKTHFLLLT